MRLPSTQPTAVPSLPLAARGLPVTVLELWAYTLALGLMPALTSQGRCGVVSASLAATIANANPA